MNRVALVTGSSRGIGLGIAHQLGKAKFDLAINGVRSENEVNDILVSLSQYGTRVLYFQGDIGNMDDRNRLINNLKNDFGRIDLLVNNAGVAPIKRTDILQMTDESYDRVMNINLKGPTFLTQAISNWMIELKKDDPQFIGNIINVSSISATVASAARGEYCISKAGVAMMTQLYAVRMAEHGISVFEIRPGVMLTDMVSAVKSKYDQMLEDGLALQKRWGQPEDVGKAVVSIATGAFPYSTGNVFMVDGGLTVSRL